MKVPVVNSNNEPLMPTTSSRARRWIKSGDATPFWKLGVFCIKLNRSSDNKTQSVVVGVDPGSKKEGYTVKSPSHTYLNLQCDASSHVKDKMEDRKNMRRARRFRNTPCRKPRWSNRGASRKKNRIPPSTKSRYDLKLIMLQKLSKIYPVCGVVVEDLKAETKKGKKRWNKSFSPLQAGKEYFYEEIKKCFKLKLKTGFSTHIARNKLSLSKNKDKMADKFDAHCVDSWVMANECVGGHAYPDNTDIILVSPLNLKRRQLHFQYKTPKEKIKYKIKIKNKEVNVLKSKTPRSVRVGKQRSRTRLGGTRSCGFKKGSVVKYTGKTRKKIINGRKYLVGGFNDKGQLTLCSLSSQSDRLNRSVKPSDCKFIAYNRFAVKT